MLPFLYKSFANFTRKTFANEVILKIFYFRKRRNFLSREKFCEANFCERKLFEFAKISLIELFFMVFFKIEKNIYVVF